MRPIILTVGLAVVSAVSWGLVSWEWATFGTVSLMSVATALVLTGLALMLPAMLRPQGSSDRHCPDCTRPVGASTPLGFCMFCGTFLSSTAEKAWAKHS